MILGVDASRAVGKRTGVGRDLQYLIEAWSRAPIPFDAVRVFAPAPIPDLPSAPPLEHHVLPGRNGGLRWQITKLRPAAAGVDVLFAPYTLPPGYSGRSVVNNLGIYEGEHAFHSRRARARSWHMARSARAATTVIANSESTRDDILRYFGVAADHVVVVWPGVADYFRPRRPQDEPELREVAVRLVGSEEPYFLLVGKLSRRRNVPALLEALQLVRREHPAVRLLLVGPNVEGLAIRQLLEERGLAQSVRHVEFVEHKTLALLYRGALAFVLPTEHEGFSFTIPEAMASGCPVVTVEHASLKDGGLDSAALVVERAEPALLARALGEIVVDAGLRARLVEAGLRMTRPLSWDETARRTMDVLARAAGTGSRP